MEKWINKNKIEFKTLNGNFLIKNKTHENEILKVKDHTKKYK